MTVVVAILLALAPLLPPHDPVDLLRSCRVGWVTGYVRTEGNDYTYDGTSIYTDEPIAAAGWNIPIDSMVEVEGVGTFRIADRGRLGNDHIDVAVWTRAEAFALTGSYRICVEVP